MTRTDIPIDRLVFPGIRAWDKQWLLLAAGDFQKQDYNCMTVGWGTFGVMWGKPAVIVAVRPTRHTWHYMEKFDSFTLCAFPDDHHPALSYIGSHSGRDDDKIMATGLTPMGSRMVRSPVFDEAELAVECRKVYFDDMDPAHFLDPALGTNYLSNDYHRLYFGEIMAASGVAAWSLDP